MTFRKTVWIKTKGHTAIKKTSFVQIQNSMLPPNPTETLKQVEMLVLTKAKF